MPRVIIRPRARRDLDGIGDYIAERAGDASAARHLRRIDQTIQAQARFPMTGRNRDELRPDLRSVPSGKYVVFFFPLPDGIRVARVLHGARDIPRIFDTEPEDDEETDD